MKHTLSAEALEQSLGEDIKAHRLQKNITRQDLCARAGISENALRNLEGGKGATLKTFIKTLKALNRASWLETIAPKTSINPLHLTQTNQQRQRAREKKHGKDKT
ncbi:MAG TPA: helix-turn-helix transcriptional regulator [Gammaproteobacteria bacterium]|jgi:transcriptional regulator with XRE-family HTH domain|nr:helix-turn-helix transcriptional regulator [Gammaproteobacteria bacterium]